MARAFTELQANQSAADLDHAEWLALLLEREATERSNRQLTARLRHARLRQRATIEDIDWRSPRGLDRSLLQRLIAGDWIDTPHNLIIEGPTGVGKSWLACALGNKACRDNRSVLYQRLPKLFADLACNTCHRPFAQGRGPVLNGLFGRTIPLEGGGSVTADEAYIRESIVNPGARITASFQPIMPTYQGVVSEEGLLQLIEYVKSLGNDTSEIRR